MEKWGLAVALLLVLSTFTLSSQDGRRTRRQRLSAARTEIPADSASKSMAEDSACFLSCARGFFGCRHRGFP